MSDLTNKFFKATMTNIFNKLRDTMLEETKKSSGWQCEELHRPLNEIGENYENTITESHYVE